MKKVRVENRGFRVGDLSGQVVDAGAIAHQVHQKSWEPIEWIGDTLDAEYLRRTGLRRYTRLLTIRCSECEFVFLAYKIGAEDRLDEVAS